MTTRRFYLLLTVAFVLCSYNAMAQTEYYCYPSVSGEKVYFTLSESKLGLIVPKENKELIDYIEANVQILAWGRDNGIEKYFITRADYEKLVSLDVWKKYSNSVILTRCFINKYRQEGVETGAITLKLKKEEDVDLLNYYIDKYKLRIVGHNSEQSPLSYRLLITVDSGTGALECANALYETGHFAKSYPEISPLNPLDGQASSGIATPKKKESSAVFDLQGRRLQGEPRKGVYVSCGRKYVLR